MQNPPPGPPPGGQPPYQPPGYQTSGIDKKTGAILSYALWWITGIIFLFVGKDPDVKFHAAQSTIFFGAITVVFLILRAGAGVIGLLGFLGLLVWLFGVVVWVMAIIQAANSNGARFPIPWIGGVVSPYADQLANAVN